MKFTKAQHEALDKKYSPLISDKKNTFNMTFTNISRNSKDKDPMRSIDNYKLRESPPKKSTIPSSTKKQNEKLQERLTFYHQLQNRSHKSKDSDQKASIDYSNYPSSRQGSRAHVVDENSNHENVDKKVLRNNLVSQRQFADMLTDVVRENGVSGWEESRYNLS